MSQSKYSIGDNELRRQGLKYEDQDWDQIMQPLMEALCINLLCEKRDISCPELTISFYRHISYFAHICFSRIEQGSHP